MVASRIGKRDDLKEEARLGLAKHDDKESDVLNCIVRWKLEGLEYEADSRQGDRFLRGIFVFLGCRGVSKPGVEAYPENMSLGEDVLVGKDKVFGALAAIADYLTADRPDIQFAAKEIPRWMSKPTV